MNCSTPGLHVHHQPLEFTQTHIRWVGDAIQAISSSVVPFSSCPQSLPASVFSKESTLHMRWPKYWSFSLSIQIILFCPIWEPVHRVHLSSPQGPRLLWPVEVGIVMTFTLLTACQLPGHGSSVASLFSIQGSLCCFKDDIALALKAHCPAYKEAKWSFQCFNCQRI